MSKFKEEDRVVVNGLIWQNELANTGETTNRDLLIGRHGSVYTVPQFPGDFYVVMLDRPVDIGDQFLLGSIHNQLLVFDHEIDKE